MHPHGAYLPLLALVRSGQLDRAPITPAVFALAWLERAMDAAHTAGRLQVVVVTGPAQPDAPGRNG